MRLASGVVSPKHKYDAAVMLAKIANYGIGKFVPTYFALAGGLVGSHCQYRVQKQYSLLRPLFEIAIRRSAVRK